MAIVAKKGGDARKPVPVGNYFGAVVGVYDLGTQPSDRYEATHKVVISFELHRKKGPASSR
jgi:hypothetical protein